MANDTRPASKRALDFTKVKDRGAFNPKHKTPGDYRLKIVKVEETTSQANNDMWVFTIMVHGDSQATYPYNCLFEENQLWKLRNLFVAAGMNVPKKRVNVDPNKIVGKEIAGTLDDDEYNGKMKSIIEAVFPLSELTADSPDEADTDETDVTDDDLDEVEIEEL